MYLNGLTAASRAPVAAAKAAGTFTGSYKGNCPAGQRQIGVDMGPTRAEDRVVCALIPKAPPPPPAQIEISPVFQQAFEGQVSPVISPAIASPGAVTSGAPVQAGNAGQTAGADIEAFRQLMAEQAQLQQARNEAQRRRYEEQLARTEVEAAARLEAAQRAAQADSQAPPQFIPGAVIHEPAPVPITEMVPEPSARPDWILPVLMLAAGGGLILMTRKRGAKRSRR